MTTIGEERGKRALWCGLQLIVPVIVVLTLLVGDLLLIRNTPCVNDALPNLVRLNHYTFRSFQEYIGRRKIPRDEGWAKWKRNAESSQCVDQTIQRFLPSLQSLRRMTWTDRQKKYHQGPFCVNRSGHAGDQENGADKKFVLRDCRAHFFVGVASINHEDAYLEEWLDYHSVVGIDHFLLYDAANSSETQQILAPYISHGAVTYIDHTFGAFDHRAPGVEEMRCYRCHSHGFLRGRTFWIINFELDEFFYPRYTNSLREVFTPLTELNGPYVALAVGYQTVSGAPFLKRPPMGGQLDNYVKVRQIKETAGANGKTFALLDFVPEDSRSSDKRRPDDGQLDCCYPHRIPIKQGSRYVPANTGVFSGTLRPATLKDSAMTYFIEAEVWHKLWDRWLGESVGPAVLRLWVPLYLLACSAACVLFVALRFLGESRDAIWSRVAEVLKSIVCCLSLGACRNRRTAIACMSLLATVVSLQVVSYNQDPKQLATHRLRAWKLVSGMTTMTEPQSR